MDHQLVFIENNQAVTDSLTVAAVFRKEHARVMRDIRELGCSEEFRVGNFAESNYVNSQNKNMPLFYMNRKGFTLLVMGYTGKEAMKYKEAYINEFERMELELNRPRVLSEKEQLMASMKLSLETAEELTQVRGEIQEVRLMVEQKITLDSGEQRRVVKAVGSRVFELAKKHQNKPALFRELHKDIKDRFGVASYKDIKSRELQTALRYIDAWVPKRVGY